MSFRSPRALRFACAMSVILGSPGFALAQSAAPAGGEPSPTQGRISPSALSAAPTTGPGATAPAAAPPPVSVTLDPPLPAPGAPPALCKTWRFVQTFAQPQPPASGSTTAPTSAPGSALVAGGAPTGPAGGQAAQGGGAGTQGAGATQGAATPTGAGNALAAAPPAAKEAWTCLAWRDGVILQ